MYTDAFGYWFSGFFDGEGCLGLNKYTEYKNEKIKAVRIKPKISIGLREDDLSLLQMIKAALNCGIIQTYYYPDCPSNKKRRLNACPQAAWKVQDIKGLAEVIVPLFDSYPLLSKKAKEYPYWRQAVLFIYSKGPVRRTGRTSDDWLFLDSCIDGVLTAREYRGGYEWEAFLYRP